MITTCWVLFSAEEGLCSIGQQSDGHGPVQSRGNVSFTSHHPARDGTLTHHVNAPCLHLVAALVHVRTERSGAPKCRRLRGAAEGPERDGPPVGSEHATGGLRPHAAAHRHRDQGSDEEEAGEQVDVFHLQQEALR